MDPETPIDKEIVVKYLRFLLDAKVEDDAEARRRFCEAEKIHPKLLYYNPHIKSVTQLFQKKSSFERLADMTLREWMLYHYYYVHQGYRYGAPELQQTWLGHDILKSPFDCWIYQEIFHKVRPDVVIELGVMFGGASHFFADILQMIGHGSVLGIDITLSKVKDTAGKRIEYLEGSTIAPEMIEQVKKRVHGKKVVVIADSDHEKNHVLEELRLYAQFVQVGSYLVAEDSLNDPMGWHPVPNEGPQAAVHSFLAENDSFVSDLRYAEKYILTLNPLGYLLRTK